MRIGIRKRLYVGFALLVLIAGCIGGYSVHQQDVVSEQYDVRGRLEQIARTILVVNGLAGRLTGFGEQYHLAPAPERLAVLEQTRREIEETAEKLIGLAFVQERRKLYVEIRDKARTLKPELDRLAAAGIALSQAKARLFTGGDELTNATNTLVAEVRARQRVAARPCPDRGERRAAGPRRQLALPGDL